MKIFLVTIATILSMTGCLEKKDTAVTETKLPEKKLCDEARYCADLRTFEAKCRLDSKEEDCAKFVEIFEKLSVRKDCQRSFDTGPVPSIWVCEEDNVETTYPKLFERSATTLSNLKFPFAKKFYGSDAFRSTLDGDIAEQHLEKSKKTK